MNQLYVYDSVGRVIYSATNQPLDGYQTIFGDENLDVLEEAGTDMDVLLSPDEHYIADLETTPTLTARPASPITLDGTTLLNVPAGAIVNIDGTEEVVETAEDVELVFPLSGTYEVRVKHFPYLDFVAEVTV